MDAEPIQVSPHTFADVLARIARALRENNPEAARFQLQRWADYLAQIGRDTEAARVRRELPPVRN
jgi:hypothetical protein